MIKTKFTSTFSFEVQLPIWFWKLLKMLLAHLRRCIERFFLVKIDPSCQIHNKKDPKNSHR